MIIFTIGIIIFIVACYFVKNKIIFRIDTFFRKGFAKHDDDYGIYCFCGKQGDGKTYSVFDFLSEVVKGKIIITNVASCLEKQDETGLFPGSHCNLDYYLKLEDNSDVTLIYESDFEKIYNFLKTLTPEQCQRFFVFYDELFSLIEKGKLDKEMLTFISQMRKRHLYLLTTVQEWLELNVTFRRYVRFMIDCKMFNLKFFNFAVAINRVYNAYEMKWDNLQNEYICPLIKTTIKKCSLLVANSYDTFEVIKTSGNLVKKSYSR